VVYTAVVTREKAKKQTERKLGRSNCQLGLQDGRSIETHRNLAAGYFHGGDDVVI
jgi:hypothetical protein